MWPRPTYTVNLATHPKRLQRSSSASKDLRCGMDVHPYHIVDSSSKHGHLFNLLALPLFLRVTARLQHCDSINFAIGSAGLSCRVQIGMCSFRPGRRRTNREHSTATLRVIRATRLLEAVNIGDERLHAMQHGADVVVQGHSLPCSCIRGR